MMKSVKIFLFITFLIIILLIFNIFSSYQKQRSIMNGDDTVGMATAKYLSKLDVYPNFLSSYLFNKYERDNLYSIQKKTPYPYLFILNVLSELPKSSADYKVDRVFELENNLVCLGLSEERVKNYKDHIAKLGNIKYLADKYKQFDYLTLQDYCNKKDHIPK